ncbi:Septum site determining protein (modular protein) [Streptantibioticus cattleyicolor NRRL 8057 = DSM 46488]|nr:Septum site determining protein (modular protein) [Streptantibioticus cattleyicolor NRRL 8057 = DSM 46488]
MDVGPGAGPGAGAGADVGLGSDIDDTDVVVGHVDDDAALPLAASEGHRDVRFAPWPVVSRSGTGDADVARATGVASAAGAAGRDLGRAGRSRARRPAPAVPPARSDEPPPVPSGRPASESVPGGPLIVTEDEDLLDDLLRLCAAAGAEPEVSFGPPARPGSWSTAPLVLVGDDCAHRVRGVVRRPGVLLIGRDLDDQDVWRRAVDLGADHVLFLPDAEPWLVDRIADAAESVGEPALTIGVVGGRGGAGASTLACALAVTSARQGRRTMLIDGDPLGGGLDVLLGGERAGGLRWPDLAASEGRVSSGALEESLPKLHDLSVLSWDRGDSVVIGPEAMRSVLGAARRRGGVVVVDLPRRLDEGVVEALAQIDVGLLVVPAELRAVAAADRVASRIGMVLSDLRVVARGPFPPDLGDEEIARLLGLPLAGSLPREKGLREAVDGGEPPGGGGRGPLAAFCSAFLDGALAGRGSVTP